MAAMSYSLGSCTGNLALKSGASDLLRSSCNDVCGIPVKVLGKGHLGAKNRRFTVLGKIRKVKKHEYPWPEDPDPNVKGGVLSHLSPFKPLKEKPKPVTLDFERPLVELQAKIVEVQKMANETGLDFSDQLISLENKYQQALKDQYTHLTPIQRVSVARHPNRPTFLDHVFTITDKFVELHGDRAGYDDPAIVTGLGTINGRNYMFIGHQKGRNTKENIHRNFGMPTPHGYRKALRMMYYADHHGFPIVTFIDTPGAYADLKSEELGQGEAIAHNLRTMFGLKVPIVSIVIGEGGSGGALAIGCANKLFMLENAVFFVASPEACAAILWKNAKASPKAAEQLKITSTELNRLQIADGIIPEPLGGAHTDPYWTSQQIKAAIVETMDELVKMDTDAILKHRHHKFRKLTGYIEGIDIDPKKKVNMKKKDELLSPITLSSEAELRDELAEVKQQIMKSGKLSVAVLKGMIEKLKTEIDYEYDEAAKDLGLEENIIKLREEVAKAMNVNDELAQLALKEKMEQMKREFDKKLPNAANYPSLMYRLKTLKELSKDEMKLEINERFAEAFNKPEYKQKFETLTGKIAGSGSSDFDSNPELKGEIQQLIGELESEFKGVLDSVGLQVVGPLNSQSKKKLRAFDEELNTMIDNAVSSSDLKDKIEMLKMEAARAENTSDEESKNKNQALIAEVKEAIKESISSPELKEKHEKLLAEVSEATKSSAETKGDEKSPVGVGMHSNSSVF